MTTINALTTRQSEIVDTHTSTISCIVPAYNEESSISATLDSILAQTLPPNVVHVIVNNSSDDTYWVASEYKGTHQNTVRGVVYSTEILVHDIGKTPDKKVGALNYGWFLSEGYDYILGIDGDTVLDRKCVQHLVNEMDGDSRIGGLSAIYTVDYDSAKGLKEKFLLAGQRQQFAGFEMDNLLRNRNMAVLGGQCSLLRVSALKEVMHLNRQDRPWVTDSSVEDSLLSLQIKSAGYQTKISARSRATVGGMHTFKSLYAQQLKWNSGAIELMRQKPFHPNLRLRWRENFSMFFNIITRVVFLLLLVATISVGQFNFLWVWVAPPAISWLLSIRTANSMKDRRLGDTLFAWSFIASELYMLIRISHFLAAWWHSINKIERDTWGLQSSAESGKGSMGVLWPITALTLVLTISGYSWINMTPVVQNTILEIGWPVLGVIAVFLTLNMLSRLIRRHRGYTV